MAWWDIWKTKSADYIYTPILGVNTPTQLQQVPLEANAGYVRIVVRSWRIDYVREGWKTFYGAVHGFVSVPQRGGGTVETEAFTSPNELKNADGRHANRIVQMNFPLFGPIPYIGGDLSIKLGLFSINSGDLSGPFLDMLSTVATLAGGGAYVAAVKPFVQPLKSGIEAVTDTSSAARLELGLVNTYSTPTTGYFAVIRADNTQVDVKTLKVDDQNRLVRMDGSGLKDFPYVVFTVEYTTRNETWADIDDLKQAYAELRVVVEAESSTEANISTAFGKFRKKVRLTPFLIPKDTDRILEEVRKMVMEVSGVDVAPAQARISPGIAAGRSRTVKRILASGRPPGSRLLRSDRVQPTRSKMPALKTLRIYKS